MNPQPISALAFDLDGIIIDSHPFHRRAWRELFLELGRNLAEAQLDFVLEGKKREDILRHFLGELSPDRIARYGARKDELYRQMESEVPPVPGILEFLRAAEDAGIERAIVTSATAVRTQRTLKRLGLERRFAVVVTGSDVLAGKPDPAIYTLVAERLGKSADSVLAFEDSRSGVTAAKSAGLPCVAVCPCAYASQLLFVGADLWFPSFRGLSLEQLQFRLRRRIAA